MSRTVVAIGGNALSDQAAQQEQQLKQAVSALLPVLVNCQEIVLVHGNGPQVGIIHDAFEYARQNGRVKSIPFYDCTAMNEGGIGYHLEEALATELSSARPDASLATVLTRVVVDPQDPAFSNPEKPVGRFYDEAAAKRLMEETGYTFGPDSGRGWRRMVPSPQPQHIIEAEAIKELVSSGTVVLGGGGAGIPVTSDSSGLYTPIEAVCDKDLISAMLAELIDADLLLILTAVDRVALDFGTPEQKEIAHMTADEACEYIQQGQFAPGSMLPKVEACVHFVRSGPGRRAVIGNLTQAQDVLNGTAGTVVTSD